MATSTATPVEHVPGLPVLNGVDSYKFLVRKSDGDTPYELVLRVPGETDYSLGINEVLDPVVQSQAGQLIYNRKIKVREKLIADSTEVELTSA